MPWSILIAAMLLVLIGWVAHARCDEFTASGGRYVRQQMLWTALGAAAAVAAAIPNYRRLGAVSYLIYGLLIAALVAVYFFPAMNNAHRWIRVAGVGFQPSDPAKLALVLALARYLRYRDEHRKLAGFLVPLVLTLVPVLLVLKEPDLGTSGVFLPVMLAMLFVAGARRGDLARLFLIGLILLPALWTQMSREQKSRVTALFEQTVPGQKPADDAYQLHQAKQMLALGGVWGSLISGPQADDPAVYYLPEARSDFVFCVVIERFGLWGAALTLALYAILVWRGLAIAAAAQDPFGRLVAAGLVALIATQVLINTGMNVGLLPVTGLSLPLVSYGGSGLLTFGLAIGLLVNIALRPGYEVSGEAFRWRG